MRRTASIRRTAYPTGLTPALLAPQQSPDCEFKSTNSTAIDPNQSARLKIDYERQCYQDAEKIARDRLRLSPAFINFRCRLRGRLNNDQRAWCCRSALS